MTFQYNDQPNVRQSELDFPVFAGMHLPTNPEHYGASVEFYQQGNVQRARVSGFSDGVILYARDAGFETMAIPAQTAVHGQLNAVVEQVWLTAYDLHNKPMGRFLITGFSVDDITTPGIDEVRIVSSN